MCEEGREFRGLGFAGLGFRNSGLGGSGFKDCMRIWGLENHGLGDSLGFVVSPTKRTLVMCPVEVEGLLLGEF